MTDREKVIKGLECCSKMDDRGFPLCEECPYRCEDTCLELDAMYKDAISLLKAQEPVVMTLEEIKPAALGGCMYWMELRQRLECFPVLMLEQKANRTLEFAAVFHNGYGPVTVGRFKPDEYNAVWRCWTSRPTDEQREAVKWDEPPKEGT